MSQTVVELEHIAKTYHRGPTTVNAVVDVSLKIHAGEITFLIGPSGSGKSTLLHIIGALDRPSSGTVVACGQRLEGLSEGARARFRRRHVGFVFQAFHLLPAATAIDNVLIGCVPEGVSASDRQRASELLDQVGLSHRAQHRPPELSGGEQQRVAIARAFMADPDLILADEPTGELDTQTGLEVLARMRLATAHGKGVVIVTHDHSLVQAGDRVVELCDGGVVTDRRLAAEAP